MPAVAWTAGGVKRLRGCRRQGFFGNNRRTLSQPTTSPFTQRNPFAAVRVGGQRLTPPGAPKDTQHHVISLAGSGILYRPGDALGVWPTNAEPLADAILRRLNVNGGEPVAVGTIGTTLREALLTKFELTNVSRRLLEACAAQGVGLFVRLLEKGNEEPLKAYLQARDNIHDVLDVLSDAPGASFPPQEFVTLLRPMQPRLYSIASSLQAHPDEVHLLVVTLSYMARELLAEGSSHARACRGSRSAPGVQRTDGSPTRGNEVLRWASRWPRR